VRLESEMHGPGFRPSPPSDDANSRRVIGSMRPDDAGQWKETTRVRSGVGRDDKLQNSRQSDGEDVMHYRDSNNYVMNNSKELNRQMGLNKIKKFLKIPKKARKEKRGAVFARFKKLGESVVDRDLNAMERAIRLAQAIYPEMLQGLKPANQPVVMSKTMEWLWSDKKFSDVSVSQP